MNFLYTYITVGVEELIALPTVEGVWQGPPPLEEGEIPPSPPTPHLLLQMKKQRKMKVRAILKNL